MHRKEKVIGSACLFLKFEALTQTRRWRSDKMQSPLPPLRRTVFAHFARKISIHFTQRPQRQCIAKKGNWLGLLVSEIRGTLRLGARAHIRRKTLCHLCDALSLRTLREKYQYNSRKDRKDNASQRKGNWLVVLVSEIRGTHSDLALALR
jgi:hypothetical protein